MRRVHLIAVVFAWTAGVLPHVLSAVELVRGTLGDAHYAIARPDREWNEGVLIIAHGYRPETAPLVADLFPEHAAYRTLLQEGWIVAKTSYRRNGLLLSDGIADLNALRDHIAATYGEPQRVILEGESMGGTIVTLIAERADNRYDGAIAIGAALDLREPNGTGGVSLRPGQPLLLVANRSEFSGPEAYRNQATLIARSDPGVVAPALFRIDRDGHVNVNQAERLVAIRALNEWLSRGRASLPSPAGEGKFHDATQPPAARPSTVTLDSDNLGFKARVVEVSAIYGNVWVDAQSGDFANIGLASGAWCQLTVGAKTFRVRYGTDFDSVDRGEWVVFPNADGDTWLARNFANAAETAGLKVGDRVQLRRYAPAD